jgi:hypothetical protein
MPLPPLLSVSKIRERLLLIFPEGTPNRSYCTREMAATTVFSMLYVGAVEGERWLSPKQVYHMSDRQAVLTDDDDREVYAAASLKPGFRSRFKRWYADNSREPIRDETLRDGLVRIGAVNIKHGVPTTSPKGRFSLEGAFAALFDPNVAELDLDKAIAAWQKAHLSPSAIARIEIIREGHVGAKDKVLVKLPSGESRMMEAGPSSLITKGVVEEFAPQFLVAPAVVWISESGNKVVHRDDQLAQRIGLRIDPDKTLPDMILADVGTHDLYLVFVEVVSTDGPIDEARKQSLLSIAVDGGYAPDHVKFLTAFMDRASGVFRQCLPRLAWGSFAWCASVTQHLIALNGGKLH